MADPATGPIAPAPLTFKGNIADAPEIPGYRVLHRGYLLCTYQLTTPTLNDARKWSSETYKIPEEMLLVKERAPWWTSLKGEDRSLHFYIYVKDDYTPKKPAEVLQS